MQRIVILGAGLSFSDYEFRQGDFVIAPNRVYKMTDKVSVICITDTDQNTILSALEYLEPEFMMLYLSGPAYRNMENPEGCNELPLSKGSGETEIERLVDFWRSIERLGTIGINTNSTVTNMCLPLAYHLGLNNDCREVAIYGCECIGPYTDNYESHNDQQELPGALRAFVNKRISITGLRNHGFHVTDYSGTPAPSLKQKNANNKCWCGSNKKLKKCCPWQVSPQSLFSEPSAYDQNGNPDNNASIKRLSIL